MVLTWQSCWEKKLRSHLWMVKNFIWPLISTFFPPVVMYGCESWTLKKAERQRIDAFELWCWRRLWTSQKLGNVVFMCAAMYIIFSKTSTSPIEEERGYRGTTSGLFIFKINHFSSVTQSCLTPWDPMDCNTPGFPVHHQLQEPTQTHVHRVSDAIQPSHPLPSPSPPAFNLTQHQGLFQWVSSSHWWPKYCSFSFSISPSDEYSGLISFRMDWLDLFAVQGTLKSLLQHHSSKALILQRSAFFMVQLSHPYMTTGKTIALTRWTFVGKVMSLLFNMPSRLVITFLPWSRCLNFMAAVTICSDFGDPPQN